MTRVALIAPNIVMQRGDFFGTGIPYMPLTLCYLASYLRNIGHDVTLIDAFGENPFKIKKTKKFLIQGIDNDEVSKLVDKTCEFVIVSTERLVAHNSVIEIIKKIKTASKAKIIVIENTQAVTSYSLVNVYKEFSDADFIVLGEPEKRVALLIDCIKEGKSFEDIDGLIYKKNKKVIVNQKKEFIQNLDELPFPAWDLLKLENYWTLGYSHGPLTSKRYLPLLTSRGCPYNCSFCVIPDTNQQKWRERSPNNVVDEIESFSKKFDVHEYHIEDLNPTIKKERIKEICKEILKRKLKVNWKISSGTKVETIDKETLDWMRKAGCSYVSISPESGSPRVLKLMNKPFNHEYALTLVAHMKKLGIATQACFVLGHPGENEEDLTLTEEYVKKLVKAGVGEIALFILTPAPGSSIYKKTNNRSIRLSDLTFSPTWRKDYAFYHKFRSRLYLKFLFWKLIYQPLKTIAMPFSLISRRFNTKIEMTLFRVIRINTMALFGGKK